MLSRILRETLHRQPRRALAAVLAIAVGATLLTALLGVSVDLTERMARELRSYGANIMVVPKTAGLQLRVGGVTLTPASAQGAIDETNLVLLKTIFWRHNIVGFAPYLSTVAEVEGQQVTVTGTWFDKPLTLPRGMKVRTGFDAEEGTTESNVFRTGVQTIAPWWNVEGAWARDEDPATAVVGARLATRLGLRPGTELTVRRGDRARDLRITGIITTGGDEEDQIFVPLPAAQSLLGLDKGADRVMVSALVEPDSKLRPDLRGLDPSEMTPEQYETWYCSPVLGAVTTQIEEVIPDATARPIRRIAEAEGAFLTQVGLLVAILTAVILVAAALAVMAAMTATVLERRGEIGLMKAIGADPRQVGLIFLTYAGLTGLIGGAVGYAAGLGMAEVIARQVFSTSAAVPPVLLPVVLAITVAVALAGSALPVRRAMRLDPSELLREV